MKTRFLTIIIAVLIAAAGCVPAVEMEEHFLQESEISLTWKGEVQVTYVPQSCQLGYNSARNEYRVTEDNLSHWFSVRCSQKPSAEGQELTADVVWTGRSRTLEHYGLSFKVSKTDDKGHVWLWNASDRIGIVIRNL